MKDEEFDKKEFDFGFKMLKIKKKSKTNGFDKGNGQDPFLLNRIKEHTEINNQILVISDFKFI
jgi:hypothetical protein